MKTDYDINQIQEIAFLDGAKARNFKGFYQWKDSEKGIWRYEITGFSGPVEGGNGHVRMWDETEKQYPMEKDDLILPHGRIKQVNWFH